MENLDDLINDATDSRETKRALAVKMLQTSLSPQRIANLLNVSEQYVSKWKNKYQEDGATGLRLAYRGKAPYLTSAQRLEVVAWIKTHETKAIEEVRDYVESQYDVTSYRTLERMIEKKMDKHEKLAKVDVSKNVNQGANSCCPKYMVSGKNGLINCHQTDVARG